jgi:hypothetical protein
MDGNKQENKFGVPSLRSLPMRPSVLMRWFFSTFRTIIIQEVVSAELYGDTMLLSETPAEYSH